MSRDVSEPTREAIAAEAERLFDMLANGGQSGAWKYATQQARHCFRIEAASLLRRIARARAEGRAEAGPLVEPQLIAPGDPAEMAARALVLREVSRERERQNAKWGFPQRAMLNPLHAVAILTEEVGEVAKEAVEWTAALKLEEDVAEIAGTHATHYRFELIQVAAVAVAMAQAFDAAAGDTDRKLDAQEAEGLAEFRAAGEPKSEWAVLRSICGGKP